MDPATRNGTPQPEPTSLSHAHPVTLLPVAEDLRDRTAPEYREWFERLTADIRQRGVQVPIIAYREGGRYRVIDGETRRLAALLAAVEKVPILVYEQKPDDKALKLGQLLANSMRRDMQPLELATVYMEIIAQNNFSLADLARAIHVKPPHVTKILSISTKLCPEAKELVAAGKLPPRAAYAISRLPTPQQAELAKKAAELPMAVETVEEAVHRMLGKKVKRPGAVKAKADGVTLVAPGDWTWEKLKELGEKLKGAAARGEKLDAPLSLLPSLLKGT